MIKKDNNIKCVIFDLGGVLIKLQPEKFFQRMNITPANLSKKIKKLEHDSFLGYKKPEKVIEEWMKLYHVKISLNKVIESFRVDYLGERIDPVYQLIKTLHNKGYLIGLLSNTNKIHFQYIRPMFDEFRDFHKLYLSYELHLMKPEKKIFDYITDDLQMKPQEILFVDDLEENIESANSHGWQTVKVSNNTPEIELIKEKLG